MLEQLRAQLKALLTKRAAADDKLKAVLTTAGNEARTQLTPEEVAQVQEARSILDALDTTDEAHEQYAESIAAVRAQIADLESLDTRRAAAAAIQVIDTTSRPAESGTVRVGQEALVYRPDDSGTSFFRDVFDAHKTNDPNAWGRLQRNREQMLETRAPTGVVADYGAFVTPQYLLDLFAPVLRAGRPFLNKLETRPLPEIGQNMTIPLGTTGTTVTPQSAENTNVSLTSYGETDLVVAVKTFAGRQIVSRQAVDRGYGIDTIIMSDLISAYVTQTNSSALLGTANAGDYLGIIGSTTITGTAMTVGTGSAVLSKIAGGAAQINASRFLPPNLIVMHPRRWASLVTSTDSNGRPLLGITQGAGFNTFGDGSVDMAQGLVGSIFNIPVLVDAGVGIAQGGTYLTDPIIITRTDDLLFWEEDSAPNRLELNEVLAAQLSVEFVLFGYSAFTALRYPVSTYVITGTGLVAPTF